MRKTFFLLTIALLSIQFGCEKLNELIVFNIKNETEVNIPSQSGLNIPLNLRSPEVATTSEQSFKNNNTKSELVETAQLSELRMTIISPENQNFDFLNEIDLYIKDSNGNEELIAFKKNIPEDGRTVLNLETTDTNLKPFIKQEEFILSTKAKTDQVVDQEIKMKINMTFRVQAQVF